MAEQNENQDQGNQDQQHEGGLAGGVHKLVDTAEKVGDAVLPEGAQDVTHAVNDATRAAVEGVANVGDAVVDAGQEAVIGSKGESGESDDEGSGSEGEGSAA